MEEAIIAKLNGIKADAKEELDSMYVALNDYAWMSNPTDWIQRYFGSSEIVDERGVQGVVDDCMDIQERDLYVMALVDMLIKDGKTYNWMKATDKFIWAMNWESVVDKFIEIVKKK